MKMYRSLPALALLLAIAIPAVAQEKQRAKRGDRKRSGERSPRQAQVLPRQLLEGLELSDEQKAKIEGIAKEMKTPIADARKAMLGVFTDQQRAARQEALKAARKAGKKPREAQKAVEEALKLTDEQKEKMAKARRAMADLQKKIREEVMAVLTPEQKKAVEEKMKKARAGRGKTAAGEKKPRGGGKAARERKKKE
ncbi:MAG: Spy/CpxP family protein refolding chaperone [Planctomycetota bacterium]|jgi:Spy/CpxP family protein refolding chaperone